MARKVYISSDISIDEKLDEISETEPLISLLWPWFLTFFDDWGRAKASPREIKNSVFQANDLVNIEVIKKALQLYHPNLIRLYEVNGKPYMCVEPAKWFKYQTHIRKEKRENDSSKIPAPIDDSYAGSREVARGSADVSEDDANRADTATDGSRDPALIRANLSNCIPSPSLSPSPSPSKDLSSSGNSEGTNIFKLFESEGFGTISSIISEMLGDLEDTYGNRWTVEAMKQAVFQGVRKLSYVDGILKSWKAGGIDTPWEIEKKAGDQNEKYERSSQRIQSGRDSPKSSENSITGGQTGWLPSSRKRTDDTV